MVEHFIRQKNYHANQILPEKTSLQQNLFHETAWWNTLQKKLNIMLASLDGNLFALKLFPEKLHGETLL